MNKLGVRLIGIYFIVWAIHDFFGLLTGQFSKKGFMGIIINAFGHDIAPWIGVFLFLYIGVQLIRLDPKGRRWSLILLWLWVIISGFLLVWIVLSPTYSIFSHADTSITLHVFYTDWPGEIRGPYRVYSVYVSIFLFYLALLYFLMRRDTKKIFQQVEELPVEKPETPPTPMQDVELR